MEYAIDRVMIMINKLIAWLKGILGKRSLRQKRLAYIHKGIDKAMQKSIIKDMKINLKEGK